MRRRCERASNTPKCCMQNPGCIHTQERYSMEEQPERAVVIAADCGEFDIDEALSELAALCDTAGAVVVAEIVQQREKPDRATYIGLGKLAEAKDLCERLNADLVVVNDELSGSTIRNMEAFLETDVIDRTALILDIFARSAATAEGKLQVELAQLNYRLPRLAGAGESLSRQGGGIGTRGPGESRLENDRRYIRTRAAALRAKIEALKKQRGQTRRTRTKTGIPVVALAGYTNVGKSSLMNALTGSEVLAQDRLFATLDPTARRLEVANLQQVILVDTVGFVSRLPHTLVDAFRSTLEEICSADLILKVADASSDVWEERLAVTDGVLNELGCGEIPSLTVFNKCDMTDTYRALPGIHVSAKTGMGLDSLLEAISEALSQRVVECRLCIPFDQLNLAAQIRRQGNIISEEYTESGCVITATVNRALFDKLSEYIID